MKTVLITGANSGIGREAAFLEAATGNRVFLICRDEKKGNQVVEEIRSSIRSANVELIIMDLSEKESIDSGVNLIKEKTKHIDVLVHNAAKFDIGQKEPEFNNSNIETVLFTNFLGPVLLNHLLLDELSRSKHPRVIAISSKGLLAYPFLRVNYENPEYKGAKFSVSRSYYQAKLVLYIWTQYMAHNSTQITYNAVRVPSVKVDVTRFKNIPKLYKKLHEIKSRKALEPKEMAKTYFFLAENDSLEGVTGKYFTEKNTTVRMPSICYKEQEWEKLTKLIEKYLGISS